MIPTVFRMKPASGDVKEQQASDLPRAGIPSVFSGTKKSAGASGNDIPIESPEENTLQYAKRLGAQYLSRIGEGLAGLPANLKRTAQEGIIGAYERTPFMDTEYQTPNKPFSIADPSSWLNVPETVSRKRRAAPDWLKNIVGLGEKKPPVLGGLTEGPTSEEIRGKIGQATEGYTEPQSPEEEVVGNILLDITQQLLPVRGRIRPGVAAASSVVSNLAENGARALGASEDQAKNTKLASMFFTTLMGRQGRRGVENYASQLYREAEQALPRGVSVDFRPEARNLNQLRNRVLAGRRVGDLAPSERFVVQQIDSVMDQVRNGKISPQTAWAAKRSLNEELNSFIYSTPERAAGARARHLGTQINQNLSNSLRRYGRYNPQFWQPFQQAEEAFGTIAQSKGISNFLQRHASLGVKGGGAVLLAEALTGHPAAIIPTIIGGGVGLGALKTGELMYRISASPVLRRYYTRAVNDAIRQDAVAMNRNLQKLDKEMKKDKEVMDIIEQIKNQSAEASKKDNEMSPPSASR